MRLVDSRKRMGLLVLSLSVCVLGLSAGCRQRKPPEVLGPGETNASRPANQDSARDETDIRAFFDRYMRHCVMKEGERAVACMASESLAYYESIRQAAANMPKSELAKEDILRQLNILIWRSEFDKNTLQTKSGKELLAIGYSRGWLEETAARKPTLGFVGSNGKKAHAMYEGASDVPSVFFVKEADGWKVSETELHPYVRRQLTTRLLNSSNDEESFLKQHLKARFKEKWDERVFDGPLEKVKG